MSYKDNQKSDRIQSATGEYRKVTGLWKKQNSAGRFVLKSGRINLRGFENMQVFGDETIFIVVQNKRKSKYFKPDYWLLATRDLGKPGNYK